jgi:hypothetical protein
MTYELMGRAGEELPCGADEIREGFSRGLDAYLQLDWEGAMRTFGALSNAFPQDKPTVLFLIRYRALIAKPPPADRSGITQLESK